MVKKSTVEQGNPLSLLNNNDESFVLRKKTSKNVITFE